MWSFPYKQSDINRLKMDDAVRFQQQQCEHISGVLWA